MSERLDAFRAAYLAAVERFNAHDFEGAFAGLPEDVEWHALTEWAEVETPVLHGRAELTAVYSELIRDFPDWRFEAEWFEQVGERFFAIRATVTATGRVSGLPVSHSVTQLYELDATGRVTRVREFHEHADAVAAATSGPEIERSDAHASSSRQRPDTGT